MDNEVNAVCDRIAGRIKGRAESADAAAKTFASSGYPGEAMRYNERAAAYRVALDEVEQMRAEAIAASEEAYEVRFEHRGTMDPEVRAAVLVDCCTFYSSWCPNKPTAYASLQVAVQGEVGRGERAQRLARAMRKTELRAAELTARIDADLSVYPDAGGRL